MYLSVSKKCIPTQLLSLCMTQCVIVKAEKRVQNSVESMSILKTLSYRLGAVGSLGVETMSGMAEAVGRAAPSRF